MVETFNRNLKKTAFISLLYSHQKISTFENHFNQNKKNAFDFFKFEVGQFLSQETFFQKNSFDGNEYKEAIILLSFSYALPFSINEQLFNYLLLIKAIKLTFSHLKITLFIPYLPYARQDKMETNLYPLGKCFLKILQQLKAEIIIICDIHNPHLLDEYNRCNIVTISFVDFWANHIKEHIKKFPGNYSIAAPDKGGKDRAAQIAHILNLPLITMEKKRKDYDIEINVSLEHYNIIDNHTIFLIDDIIDTGTTLLQAARMLKNHKAASIIACITHAIFSKQSSLPLLKEYIDYFYITNTICPPENIHLSNMNVIDSGSYCIENYFKGKYEH